MNPTAYVVPIATPDGEFVAMYSDAGLCGLRFPNSTKPKPTATKPPANIASWHRLTVSALLRALAGQSPVDLPPLDTSAGTSFQQAVWRALGRIPPGRTSSYGEVAHAIGSPKACRAVGGACGANPIPVLVPCHRVVAAHGPGGFSADPKWKRLLLSREGVSVAERGN